jgi:starch synthase
VIFSAYNENYNEKLDNKFIEKVKFDGIEEKDINILKNPVFINIAKIAFKYSDGIIRGSKSLSSEMEQVIKKLQIPVLDYQSPEKYIDAYSVFYDKILTE